VRPSQIYYHIHKNEIVLYRYILYTLVYNAHALKSKSHRSRLSSRLHDGKPSQITVACGRAAGRGRRGGPQGGCSCCFSSVFPIVILPHGRITTLDIVFSHYLFSRHIASAQYRRTYYILPGQSTYAVLLFRITR
jgi:hypothetical protein